MDLVSSDLDRLAETLGEDTGAIQWRFLRAVLDAAAEGIVVVDTFGRMMLANERLAIMLGVEVRALFEQPLLGFIDPQDRSHLAEVLRPGLAGSGGQHEFRLLHRFTMPVYVTGTFVPLVGSDGAALGTVALITDLTGHREIEEQLRWRLRYEEAAAYCAQSLVGTVDLDEALPRVCRKLLEATSVSRVYVFEDIDDPDRGLCMRQRCEAAAPGILREISDPILQRLPYAKCAVHPLPAFEAGRHFECLVREVASDHDRGIMEKLGIKSVLLLPIFVGGRRWGHIGFNDCRVERFWRAEDIRVLRTAATILGSALENDQVQARVRAYQGRLRRLASELTLAEERGRRRVAGDLHDDVSQSLALATMRLKTLAAHAPAELAPELAGVGQLVEQVLQHVRTLTFDLSPPVLYELGLAAAVEWLADRMRDRHALSVAVDAPEAAGPVDETTRVLVFRAVRELLVNVVKHAGVTEARVTVSRSGAAITLVVEDDGRGFDLSEVQARSSAAGGFGLFDIRERLAYIGGRLDLQSTPGRGTRAVLYVPLSDDRIEGDGGMTP